MHAPVRRRRNSSGCTWIDQPSRRMTMTSSPSVAEKRWRDRVILEYEAWTRWATRAAGAVGLLFWVALLLNYACKAWTVAVVFSELFSGNVSASTWVTVVVLWILMLAWRDLPPTRFFHRLRKQKQGSRLAILATFLRMVYESPSRFLPLVAIAIVASLFLPTTHDKLHLSVFAYIVIVYFATLSLAFLLSHLISIFFALAAPDWSVVALFDSRTSKIFLFDDHSSTSSSSSSSMGSNALAYLINAHPEEYIFKFAYEELLVLEISDVSKPFEAKAKERYSAMMRYLYAHRRGLDELHTRFKLDSRSGVDCAAVQEVAAEMVTFWVSDSNGVADHVVLPPGLVRELVKKSKVAVGPCSRLSMAASRSVEALLSKKPQLIPEELKAQIAVRGPAGAP